MPRQSKASLSVVSIGPPRPHFPPPPELGGLERETWLQVVAGTDPGHFQASDSVLLAAFCRAAALERRASEELSVCAVVGSTPSPWLLIHKSAAHSLADLATRLRLTPKSRTPGQRAGRKGPPPSYYDTMGKP
jgi:phage terminase small subunit